MNHHWFFQRNFPLYAAAGLSKFLLFVFSRYNRSTANTAAPIKSNHVPGSIMIMDVIKSAIRIGTERLRTSQPCIAPERAKQASTYSTTEIRISEIRTKQHQRRAIRKRKWHDIQQTGQFTCIKSRAHRTCLRQTCGCKSGNTDRGCNVECHRKPEHQQMRLYSRGPQQHQRRYAENCHKDIRCRYRKSHTDDQRENQNQKNIQKQITVLEQQKHLRKFYAKPRKRDAGHHKPRVPAQEPTIRALLPADSNTRVNFLRLKRVSSRNFLLKANFHIFFIF